MIRWRLLQHMIRLVPMNWYFWILRHLPMRERLWWTWYAGWQKPCLSRLPWAEASAINPPELISDAADKFGRQCVVVAIDARRREDGSGWNVYKNGGRIDTGLDAVEWAMKADSLGAGEILLTSMDCDGTKAGYDNELTSLIAENVSVPVIASGGAGTKEHFYDALTKGKADAALAASLFHYKELEIRDLKQYLRERGISVRL